MDLKKFRPLQKKVMRSILTPIGFDARSSGLYVRRIGRLVQGIDYQTDGDRFTVNLAFHFDFLPSLRGLRSGSPPWTWDRFNDELDFLFSTRIAGAMHLPRDKWWSKEGSVNEVEQYLVESARGSLGVFDDLHQRWGDPGVFYRILEPHLFRLRTFSIDEPFTGVGGSVVTLLVCPWGWGRIGAEHLARFMWMMAEHDENDDLRREYRQIERDLHQYYIDKGCIPPGSPVDPVLLGD